MPTGGGARGRRPPHVIAPDEVAAWLADSANKLVTYHRTTREAAADILDRGVDVSRSRIGSYGQGFYTATDVSQRPGDADLQVAVWLLHPLIGDAVDVDAEIDQVVRRLAGPRGRLTLLMAARVRQVLLAEGYDGLVVHDAEGDGIDYVIALEAGSVKVVRP